MSNSTWLDWLDKGLDVAKVVAGATPIGTVLTVVDAVVEKANDGVSNNTVIETLSKMSKSSWNSLTPEKLERIEAILNED